MNDFYHTLLGEMPTGAFWAYFLLATFGMVISWLTQYGDNMNNIKASGGFKLPTWLLDNWPRLLWNPMVIIVGIVLYKELEGEDISKTGAVIMGLASDVIIDRLKGMVAIARGKK